MKEKTWKNISFWQFENLMRYKNINHYVSGRLNLSFKVGESNKQVEENRSSLSGFLGITPDKLIFPDQTHSNNVSIVTENSGDFFPQTDALVTNVKGIFISVMSADCVPILLYDQKEQVIAAVHSGWRGTTGLILNKTIEVMKKELGVVSSNLIVSIGPSICQSVYEVGEEVILAIHNAYPADSKELIKEIQGRKYLDLWKANAIQALKAGVLEKNIEIAGICTFLNEDKFFSARKSGLNTGRFAAGIMLQSSN